MFDEPQFFDSFYGTSTTSAVLDQLDVTASSSSTANITEIPVISYPVDESNKVESGSLFLNSNREKTLSVSSSSAPLNTECNNVQSEIRNNVIDVDATDQHQKINCNNLTTVDPSTSSEKSTSDEDIKLDINIRNVMCTFQKDTYAYGTTGNATQSNFQVPCHVNLRTLTMGSVNVEYDNVKNVVIKQKRWPYCRANIYSSGKVTIVGCSSIDDAKRAAKSIGLMIKRAVEKPKLTMRNYAVNNIMATSHVGFGLDLPAISSALGTKQTAAAEREEISYETELRPDLVWRLKSPKVTLKIYHTGSVTVVGAREAADITSALLYAYKRLRSFRVDQLYKPRKPVEPVYDPPPAAVGHHLRRMKLTKEEKTAERQRVRGKLAKVTALPKAARPNNKLLRKTADIDSSCSSSPVYQGNGNMKRPSHMMTSASNVTKTSQQPPCKQQRIQNTTAVAGSADETDLAVQALGLSPSRTGSLDTEFIEDGGESEDEFEDV